MEKLTPKDIKLKTRGKQAKEHIIEKYFSVENFAKIIDISSPTVYQYLKGDSLGSAPFKYKLMKEFDMGIDELVLEKEQQITKFVNTILHNYTKYTSEDDLITFEKIMELCIKEKMDAEIITMERNKAMYYFNDKRTKQAIEMLEEIIEKAYDQKFYYHWLYFNCDLAVIYSYVTNHKKAQQIYDSLHIDDIKESNDEEFKDRTLYKYHYHHGVLCNRTGQHDKAKMMFEESLKHITRDTDEGVAMVGIGLSYKMKGEYDKALEYYFQALEIQPSIELKIRIVNNIAEVYKQKKEYDIAMRYINKALGAIEFYEIDTQHIAYVTYLEIKFLQGNTEETLEELMEWAVKGNRERVTKVYILTALKSVVNLAKQVKYYDYLLKVEELIMNMIYKSEEKAFIRNLKECLGDISIFFYEEKYIRRSLNEKESI